MFKSRILAVFSLCFPLSLLSLIFFIKNSRRFKRQYINHLFVLQNNGQYMITADTCPRNALVTASALDCSGRNLPPCIGKLTIVLPASMPKVYLIKLKLIVTDPRLETLMNNFPREHILHDINLKLTTHTADIQHGDVQDSRSLSYLETPLKKLRLNGECRKRGGKVNETLLALSLLTVPSPKLINFPKLQTG